MSYHFSASLIGWHGIEPFFFSVENADTGGPIHFMSREYIEIYVECLHIDRLMQCALRPVDKYGNIVAVGDVDNIFDGIDCSQHIRYMSDGDQFGLFVESSPEGIHIEYAFVIDRNDPQLYFTGTL